MSSRKSKRGQKLGSSRRNKNRNQETEEKDNDDGYQDPGKEEHESECQFLTVSENQSSNESSLLHPDQQVVVCTSPSSSVLEFSPQPQSQEFNVVLPQADITGKKRKMGSTRKGNRNFKFEEISEDEPEHRVQLSEGVSDEQKVDEEASIKEYGGKEDQTSLMDLKESFILQEKHFGLDIIMQNEGHSKNYEYRHLEAALQSKHMDISSSEPNQSNEAEFSQDLMHDQSNLNCIINDTLEVTGVQSASLIYEHEHMTEDDKKATVIWDNVNNKASTEDGKTSKERKIGLNQKSNRNVKFEGVYMDEHEHSIQLSEGVSDEQKIILDSPIKEDGGKENQTSLMDCSHSQSSESLSSVLQGKHFGLDTIMQNEDHSKNDKYHHLEEAVQSKPMDIFSSEPNQSKEAEFSQDLKHDQSSLNVMVKGTLEGSHAEDIVQDEVTGVQSASLIYEHEHMPKDDKMSTVIWENVNSKASTEDEKTVEHCLEHKDKPLQLPEESIYKSESTEVREDTDEYKEVSAAWDRTDNDSYEGLTKTNLNQTMVPDTNIVSHLKMKDQELGTSSEQILSDEFQFQGDSEIKCYREEKNDLSEARCWSGKSSADEKKGNAKNEVDMHYNEEKYRATGTEREVEYDDMQSANSNQLLISKGSSTNMFDSVSESEHIPAKTLYGATESNSKTCNLQHNNPKEFPTELEMKSKEGNCSDQMAEKVDEDRSEFSDIETEVAGEENNDIKEEIHAISTESFTKEDFKRVDDEKDDMSTFMNELEMASVITNIQDYAITGQASIVIEDHGIESPDKRSTCPYLDSVELIHETQVKLDIPVYNPIPDQKQNMYDDCQVYPTNAEQFESTFPIVYMQESRQVEDNSASENLRFNPSKKNKIDSFQRNLSGQNSGGDQNAMEETIQVQSLEESTPFSEDETLNFTAETCYHHSLNMIEPEAKKIDENVIKAEHLVDTEVLKMQSRTEVAESIIQNEETTWERDKHNQPISLEDLRQNTYPDLTLEQSKTWECAEIVTDRINTDHSVTFAEPIDAAEEEHLLEEKILQATPTTIPSTNSNRRKMGSICKTLGEKKNEKDKEEDMYVEEKDMAFTKRSMLLGPETGAREEKDNDRKKEINAGHRGKLKTEAEYTQQYMYSEISSQTVLSFQTTIKHSSSPTEHTDFRKDNKNSIENVESRNAEIQLQTQTRKKKKIGSTRRPGGKHKPPPEGEEGEWKELENAEEIEHQLITQDVASSLINEPQNTMSEVTPNIHDSTVTTEQIEIITTDVETGTGGIDAPPAILSIEVNQMNTVASHEVGTAGGIDAPPGMQVISDMQLNTKNIHIVVSDQDQNITQPQLENLTNWESEHKQPESTNLLLQVQESQLSQVEVIKEIENSQEQKMDQNSTISGVIQAHNNDTKEEIKAGPTENFTKEDITSVCSQQYVLCELTSQTSDLGLITIENPSPLTEHPDFKEDEANSIKNVESRNAEIQPQTQTRKKKKIGSTRRPRGGHQPPPEGEEGEWKELENAEEIEHQLITQDAASSLINDPQNTMSEVTPNIHDSTVTTKQVEIITTDVETGTGGIEAAPAMLSIEVDQINTVASHEVGNAEGLTHTIKQKEKSAVHEVKDSVVMHLDEQEMAPVVTKIQDDALIEHVSLTVRMHDNEIPDNKCASRANVHSTRENVDNSNAEILTQTQPKTKKKFGSTRRPRGRHQPPPEGEEGEWKELENAEEIEHQIKTQVATSNLINEPQITRSEVTPNIHDTTVTTEQIEIITTDVETGTGGIEAAPAILSIEVDQMNTVASHEVGTAGGIDAPPGMQVISDMQLNTKNIHTVVSDQDQNITQPQLENLTNWESEHEQPESTNLLLQVQESQLSQVEVVKEIENSQEQKMDQNSTISGVIQAHNNDTKEEIKAGPTENFTKEDITSVCSQQYVLCELTSQTSDLGLITIENPSPSTEHPDFKEDEANSIKNVESRNAEIQPQTQTRKKKKIGSTRRPRGGHQPPPEGEEGEWKELENAEEIEHQLITQDAASSLINEPQNTRSEVTPNIHDSTVTTKQIEIITTDVETGTGGIEAAPAMLSIEVDQINTVASHEVGNAEGLTHTIKQKEKSAVHEVKDSVVMHLDEQEMAPVVTKIQDDALIEHVSLTVKMHDNEIPDNECASRANVHSTRENVDNSNAEILTQTQPKTKKKFGSTRRPRGRHQPPPEGEEGEWKELENAEEIEHQLITQDAASSLINEPQNTRSEVTPNFHDTTVTTEQIEIITTEVHTGTGGIDAPPTILSIEVDQMNTMASHEVGNAEGLTHTIKQKEKSAVHKVKDSVVMHLDEQEMAPVVTKIQDDALIEHVSLTVRMHDNEIPDNECASRANVHSTRENVDNSNAEILTQTQPKTKKKFGSTRRPRGRHQPPPEGEEGEWKELENAEEIEHQLITQDATSSLINEPQNTRSEVTPNIHDSTVTTEQIEIITTDVETGTGGIEAAPAMLSIEVDQINTVASHEVGNAEGLTDTIEQKEKSAVHEVRDSVVMHLDEQEITPVVTKIQDDALIEHVSLTVRMHDNEICDNECASRANVHPTCENVDNSNSEIQTERPHKKKKKFGSTRRPRGGHQPPPEGEEEEWKDLENTEEIQCIDQTASSNLLTELENAISESLDTHSQLAYPIQLIPETQAILDMPVVSEQYHTMFEEPLENPKNNESEKEQCDITCPVVHIQELNLAPDYMAKQSSGDSNSGRRKKIGSTRRSLRLIKEKENIQEQTSGESTPNSAKDNGQKGAYHLTAEISHQSIQTHSDPLNIIEHEAEEMGSTCKNLEEGQSKQEAWQRSTDMSPRYVGDYDKKYLKFVSNEDMVNTESSSCDKKASVQEYKTKIHQKLDQSEGSLLSEIELYLNKSFENTLIPTVLNPNISEFLEPMFEGSLQLPSSQNPQIYMEQSSPSRKRKMGSSRKMPRNKHEEKTLNESEGPEQEKENLNKNRVKNSEPKTEAKLVEKTVMAEGTEDMKESAELMSEVQALSEINESSTQVTEQPFPEGRRKFGSRRTRKGCSGLGAFTHGDYESNQENTDIQMTKDLRVSDPCFISEPKSPPISHQVSEARPGTEVVTKVKDTNISPDADLVSLDSNRKTSPSVVSTGIRQKIDFEQWNEQIPDFGQLVYNIVMVGNSSVGKTSFIKRLQSGHFIPDYSSTIGVDTFVHTVTFGSKTVKLYVWDTAGQERYHSITRQVFHKAQGLLLMYDITSSQSFHAVRAWISQIQENAHPDVILMLLGNKNDCADREVPLHEGETLSKEYDIHFMECSVATGENVSESLKTLAWLLMKQRVKKEEEHKTLQPKPQQNKKSGCC